MGNPGNSNRRLLGISLCMSILIVTLLMWHMLGYSYDPVGNTAFFASHVDTVVHNIGIKIKASFKLPHNKHVDMNGGVAPEIESCMSVHKINQTFLKEQEEIHKRRKTALAEACHKYHDESSGPHAPAVALILDEYHLVYAQTAKIAGTSWDRVLLVLSHLANSTDVYGQSKSIDKTKVNIPTLQNYQKEDRQVILQNFTTFMFSRHPFSRLLSAYNCKIGPDAKKDHIKRGFFDKMRMDILKRYPTNIHSKKGIPDFRGFVSYILNNDCFTDPHWKENYKIVAPCDVPYDIIGRFETLHDDAKYILQSVGADCVVEFPSSKGSAATNSSEEDVLVASYQTLSRDLIQRLYRKYRLDFLLFGYTFEINIGGELLRFPPHTDQRLETMVTQT